MHLLLLFLLSGCSEYNLSGGPDVVDPPAGANGDVTGNSADTGAWWQTPWETPPDGTDASGDTGSSGGVGGTTGDTGGSGGTVGTSGSDGGDGGGISGSTGGVSGGGGIGTIFGGGDDGGGISGSTGGGSTGGGGIGGIFGGGDDGGGITGTGSTGGDDGGTGGTTSDGGDDGGTGGTTGDGGDDGGGDGTGGGGHGGGGGGGGGGGHWHPGGHSAGGSARMTGGGVTDGENHGFILHCDFAHHHNNLEVNCADGHFHLEGVDWMECVPGTSAGNPYADFDTIVGTGYGRLNGQPANIWFSFSDEGEPGTQDQAHIEIDGPTGMLSFNGRLAAGNHQAHSPL